MNRPTLLVYQLLIGISDSLTGALLMIAPEFTLRLMHVHVPADALSYLSFIGAFVFATGLACFYGAFLTALKGNPRSIETVWLLTGFTRASVAIFIGMQILAHALEPGWTTVALTDGACVVVQAIGLRKHWLDNVAR